MPKFSQMERRLRVCAVQKVTGSHPELMRYFFFITVYFVPYRFALLFCILVSRLTQHKEKIDSLLQNKDRIELSLLLYYL